MVEWSWKILCLVVLLCNVAGETQSCQRDNDCTQNLYICNNSNNECQRKNIFPITLQEFMGSLCILFVVGVGQAAGIGGGLVVVPLLMSFYNYDAKKSIAVVFITIFSAAFGNLISFMKMQYKDGGPLIDYRVVLLSVPTIMMGSIYGVQLNNFLPQIAISVMLVYFICKNLSKSYTSFFKEKLKEDTEKQQKLLKINPRLQNFQQLQGIPVIPALHQGETSTCQKPSKNGKSKTLSLDNSSTYSERQYPKALLKKIACITICFTIFSFLRGGKKFESLLEIPACGLAYHISNLALLFGSFMLVKTIIEGFVVNQTIEIPLIKITPQKHDHLSAQDMQSFSVSAFLAGLIGSIVGIGGGMILIPKWLEFGIPAQRTTACSIFLLFLTAFNNVLQFSLAGVFNLDEILYFGCLALLSSFMVSSSILQYVQKNNQHSLLILIIIIFMIIALIIFSTLTFQKASQDFESLFLLGEFC